MQFVSRYIDWEESEIPFPCLQMICLSNPSKKKHLPNFPPKKKQQKHVCPNLLSGHFSNPKNINFFPKKLQGLDAWEKSLVESHRRDGWWDLETRKGAAPLISESEKKSAGDFFFRRWIQNRCNYRTSEWSFTRGFGDLLLTAPQNGGNDEYVSNGLKKWSEGFFFSWGSDGMRTNVYMSTFQVLHMPPGSLHHKHNMFSFCSGHHLIGEHNSAYLTHITLLSPHIVHPRGLPEPLKTCGSKSTFLLGR